MGGPGAGGLKSDLAHDFLESLAVFRLVDRFGRGADQLHAVAAQNAVVRQVHRAVERGLAAHRREDRIGALLFDDARHRLPGDRFNVGRIRRLRIGHDRRRVGVDENRAVALFAQHPAGLHARVVEFARLTDDDRAGADDENGLNVCTLRHFPETLLSCVLSLVAWDYGCLRGRFKSQRLRYSARLLANFSKRTSRSCGPGLASGWPWKQKAG